MAQLPDEKSFDTSVPRFDPKRTSTFPSMTDASVRRWHGLSSAFHARQEGHPEDLESFHTWVKLVVQPLHGESVRVKDLTDITFTFTRTTAPALMSAPSVHDPDRSDDESRSQWRLRRCSVNAPPDVLRHQRLRYVEVPLPRPARRDLRRHDAPGISPSPTPSRNDRHGRLQPRS